MTWSIFTGEGNQHLETVVRIMESGSDHEAVILGGTLLEDAVLKTLLRWTRKDLSIQGKLTNVGGKLDTIAAQIDMLYLLEAIEKPLHEALLALNTVRNKLAHDLGAMLSDPSQKLSAALAKLTLHEGRGFYPNPDDMGDLAEKIGPVDTARDRYIVNLRLGLAELMHARIRRHRQLTGDQATVIAKQYVLTLPGKETVTSTADVYLPPDGAITTYPAADTEGGE